MQPFSDPCLHTSVIVRAFGDKSELPSLVTLSSRILSGTDADTDVQNCAAESELGDLAISTAADADNNEECNIESFASEVDCETVVNNVNRPESVVDADAAVELPAEDCTVVSASSCDAPSEMTASVAATEQSPGDMTLLFCGFLRKCPLFLCCDSSIDFFSFVCLKPLSRMFLLCAMVF